VLTDPHVTLKCRDTVAMRLTFLLTALASYVSGHCLCRPMFCGSKSFGLSLPLRKLTGLFLTIDVSKF
jgi:hypothetical protein